MFRVSAVALFSLALPAMPVLAADAPTRGPVSVFVQARPDEAERSASEQAALKSKSEVAWKSKNDLLKSLKKEFGKDRAKWPQDQRQAFYAVVDAAGIAWSESYYYARPATEKADSVADFQKHLGKEGKNKFVTLATKREDADLVIEVMGRKGYAKFVSGPKYLAYDVLPGKVPGEALLKLPRDQFNPWFEDRFWTLHWPKPLDGRGFVCNRDRRGTGQDQLRHAEAGELTPRPGREIVRGHGSPA